MLESQLWLKIDLNRLKYCLDSNIFFLLVLGVHIHFLYRHSVILF